MTSRIRISPMRNSSVLRVYSERNLIQTNPDYQRMGEIWDLGKRQLLIDSILNDYDIPKLYLHEFPNLKVIEDGRTIKYAIIDGRQRLEAIWGFIDGKFALSDDFNFIDDDSIKAGGMTYSELSKTYPEQKTRMDSYTLPIITVVTDELDLIEDMFSRLNEAVPLNAAEKRNAIGGPMAKSIRDITKHAFFKENIPFSNKRYQHREVCAKFLLLGSSIKIMDVKKAYLDAFVKKHKLSRLTKETSKIVSKVENTLNLMNEVFIVNDPLLQTQAMTVIYFLVFKRGLEENWVEKINRVDFLEFDKKKQINRNIAEKDITKASYDLLEFDRVRLRGSNDVPSLTYRLDVILNYVYDPYRK